MRVAPAFRRLQLAKQHFSICTLFADIVFVMSLKSSWKNGKNLNTDSCTTQHPCPAFLSDFIGRPKSSKVSSRNKHLGANDTASHRIQTICACGWTQTQKNDTVRCHRDTPHDPKSMWTTSPMHRSINIVPCNSLSRSKVLFQMQNKVAIHP